MKEDDNESGGRLMPPERDDAAATEKTFDQTEVPSWKNQLTFRAAFVSIALSLVFNVIVCKLNLTTGIIPSLNVAGALLGYAMIKAWTVMIEKCGLLKQPFTRQENTVIQTCIVASSGVAFSSGTASYLLGMSPKIAATQDAGFSPLNIKSLSLGWMIGYLFIVSFVGLFSIVPLRKMMILRYKLTYPSGTATAYLINGFHTPKGAKLAKKQVCTLFKSFVGSFCWSGFKWFFTYDDDSKCGFGAFPSFGLKAFKKKFFFDFSTLYVGVGMICPYMVNISMLVGAVISWGILWPHIQTKEGDWYPAGLGEKNLHGIQGYRIFLSISLMLGDGIFHFLYMLIVTAVSLWQQKSEMEMLNETTEGQISNYDEKKRTEYFLKDQIPNLVAISGYVILAIISIAVVPKIFHQLRWYHILVAYCMAPVLAFCNAYGCGLTDWSLASSYGKLAIIIFSAWVGLEDGGVIAGLAACGVMMSIVSTASDLIQDFKTGYLTLSSPRSMFFSQVFGTAIGCVISPLVFWFFNKAYDLGDPDGPYPAPFAGMYRGIALIGSQGFSTLPKNCVNFMILCFCAAIAINILTEVLKKIETKFRIYRFIPSPMCMAIPFYLGGFFAIDMCVGSLILFMWRMNNKKKAKDFGPAVASGLISGESLWSIPAAKLSLIGITQPMCMTYFSQADWTKVKAIVS